LSAELDVLRAAAADANARVADCQARNDALIATKQSCTSSTSQMKTQPITLHPVTLYSAALTLGNSSCLPLSIVLAFTPQTQHS